MTALQITAYAVSRYDSVTRTHYVDLDVPQNFRISSEDLATREEAEALLALFPKSAKGRVTHVSGFNLPAEGVFVVKFEARLAADGVNGGTNETGVRRYRSIIRSAAKAGLAVDFCEARALNTYPTRERFESAL